MPKKAHVKKKKFQAACRNQVKNGYINQANGNWDKANTTKAMDRDMIAGYHLNR